MSVYASFVILRTNTVFYRTPLTDINFNSKYWVLPPPPVDTTVLSVPYTITKKITCFDLHRSSSDNIHFKNYGRQCVSGCFLHAWRFWFPVMRFIRRYVFLFFISLLCFLGCTFVTALFWWDLFLAFLLLNLMLWRFYSLLTFPSFGFELHVAWRRSI